MNYHLAHTERHMLSMCELYNVVQSGYDLSHSSTCAASLEVQLIGWVTLFFYQVIKSVCSPAPVKLVWVETV